VVLNVNKKMTLELHKKSKAGYYSVVPLVQPRNQADRSAPPRRGDRPGCKLDEIGSSSTVLGQAAGAPAEKQGAFLKGHPPVWAREIAWRRGNAMRGLDFLPPHGSIPCGLYGKRGRDLAWCGTLSRRRPMFNAPGRYIGPERQIPCDLP